MVHERIRPRPARTDRGRQQEHDQALGPDYTPTAVLVDQLGSHDAGDRRLAAAELQARFPEQPESPPDPRAELDAVARRIAIEGDQLAAFALSALANGTPTLGRHLVQLIGGLLDERDELELRLFDHAAREVRRRGAT